MRIRFFPLLLGFCIPCFANPLMLNSNALDPALFRVTQFATGLSGPLATIALSDGSIAISAFPGIARYVDADRNGISDGPGTALFSPAAGPHLGLIKVGGDYIDSNYGSGAITILRPERLPMRRLRPSGRCNSPSRKTGSTIRPASPRGPLRESRGRTTWFSISERNSITILRPKKRLSADLPPAYSTAIHSMPSRSI